MTAVLEIQDLRKSYTQHLQRGAHRDVLRGVDLTVQRGEFVMLRGESGSGKSSLLRCIYRSAMPDSGRILVRPVDETVDLAELGEREVLDLRRTCIGMATQFLQVVPRVSANDLVAEAGDGGQPAAELLHDLGLRAELHSLPPATFSGGERQIVNLALALALRRPLLLLDEVTSALDPERRARVLGVLGERKLAGVTILAAFHDQPAAAGLVDRELRLRDGVVAA